MSIFPLPQFEADVAADEAARKARADDKPKAIVVRFGVMGLIGEFPFHSDLRPGCGSKVVIRTQRGDEIGELLTSACPNSGCSKSVSRKEMLEYIDRSGGRDYPFFKNGIALRVATNDDMQRQADLEADRKRILREAAAETEEAGLGGAIRFIAAEPILGGERLTLYFAAEDRVDFKGLANQLGQRFDTRVELRQIGARDEARLTADYEKCGQQCCCQRFLKVLKPVSMRAAKVQKATLDPMKISGRCGRLMCCLRYEDETYTDLKAKLPNRKTRVGTPEGTGIVVDSQILTQLVLVELDHDRKRVAVPLEELSDPDEAPRHQQAQPPAPNTHKPQRPTPKDNHGNTQRQTADTQSPADTPKRRRRGKANNANNTNTNPQGTRGASPEAGGQGPNPQSTEQNPEQNPEQHNTDGPAKEKRRTRRRRKGPGETPRGENNDGNTGKDGSGSKDA